MASAGEFPPESIPFDAPRVELSHHGEDCTFETLLERFGVAATGASGTSPRSSPTWDLRDDLAIRGLLSICEEHAEVLAQGLILFDGLYATVSSR